MSIRRARRLLMFLAVVWSTPLWAQGVSFALQPGDLIELKVYPEASLSGSVSVDERGVATFPILGAVRVAGRVWTEVRDSLTAAYGRELRDPVISLTPLRRISVLGSVNKAGVYLVDPTLPMAAAIALAEGASEVGDLRRIRVVRQGRTMVADIPVEQLLADADVRSGDQLFVARRTWWDRNSGAVVAAAVSAMAVAITTLASR